MWQKPLKQDDKWRKQYWMIIGNCVKRRFMKSFDWLKNIVVSRERNSNHCCSLDKGKTVFTVRTHPVLEEFCVVSWTKVDRRWKLECEDPWQWTMQYTCTHVTVHHCTTVYSRPGSNWCFVRTLNFHWETSKTVITVARLRKQAYQASRSIIPPYLMALNCVLAKNIKNLKMIINGKS